LRLIIYRLSEQRGTAGPKDRAHGGVDSIFAGVEDEDSVSVWVEQDRLAPQIRFD
jgi:hypothetical protein